MPFFMATWPLYLEQSPFCYFLIFSLLILQRFDSKVMDLIDPNLFLLVWIVGESFVLSGHDITVPPQ